MNTTQAMEPRQAFRAREGRVHRCREQACLSLTISPNWDQVTMERYEDRDDYIA
jgi:hypothetical protein